LPENHLARFVVEIIEGLDFRQIYNQYKGVGITPYDPKLLMSFLFYGYAQGYVRYKPSKSFYHGSGVTIITFNNTGDNTGGIISDNTTGKTNDITTDKTGDTPLINNYKTILNKQNSTKPLQTNTVHAQEELNIDNNSIVLDQATKRFQEPMLKEVESYFKIKEIESMEANRLYNHFESNGWKVMGKSAMLDWKAATINWHYSTCDEFGPI